MFKLGNWFIFSLITLFLWGFWGFFSKLAVNYINPKSALIFQSIGNFIVLIFLLLSMNFKPEIHLKGIMFTLLAGISASLGFLFFLLSVTKNKVSIIMPITALYPIITIILALFILKEPITLKQAIGIMLAIISMALLSL